MSVIALRRTARSKSRMHSEIVEARIIEIREERAGFTFEHYILWLRTYAGDLRRSPKTAVRGPSPTGLNAEAGGSGVPGGRNFVKTNFWPRFNFPHRRNRQKRRVCRQKPAGVQKSTTGPKGENEELCLRKIVAEASLTWDIHLSV